jgi:16S rRNA processing protein RimM
VAADASERRILVGAVAGAHGVRGEVKIKSFTEQVRDVAAYGPVEDESGTRRFAIKIRGEAKGLVIASLDGVGDRNAAEALKGLRLYVPRAALGKKPKRAPKGSERWFVADLVGLAAVDTNGAALGTVKNVANYGAGDILEVTTMAGETQLYAFTKRTVPEVDIANGRVVIDPPVEVEAKEEDGSDE